MEVSLDVAVANRFISSLSKSLQALCHGCMDFDSGIEIDGYINVNIDCGSKVYYVLNEKVQKSTNNSMTFVSNSFLAKKDQTKPTRDGACSPVAELQSVSFSGHHQQSFNQHYSGVRRHMSNSQVLRGAQKRAWSGQDRDWRSPRKHSRRPSFTQASPNSHTSAHAPSFETSSTLLHQSETSVSSDRIDSQEIQVKKEAFDNENQSSSNQENVNQTADEARDHSDCSNVKTDPDSLTIEKEGSISGLPSAKDGDNLQEDNFLQQSSDQTPITEQLSERASPEESDFNTYDNTITEYPKSDSDNIRVQFPANQNEDGSIVDGPTDVSNQYDESVNDVNYPQTSYGGHEGAAGFDGNFDVIEIDDEDEDVQAMFGNDHFNEAMKSSCWKAPQNLQPCIKKSYHGDSMLQRQFWCSLCNQSFTNSLRLNEHIAERHNNAFPYTCEICFKGYTTRMGLTYHMHVHGGKTFSCPVCNQNFTRMFAMKRHLKKVHQDQGGIYY